MKQGVPRLVAFFIGIAMLAFGVCVSSFDFSHLGLSYFVVAFGSLTLIFIYWTNRKVLSWNSMFTPLMLAVVAIVSIMPDSWRVTRIAIAIAVVLVSIIKMLIPSKKDGTKAT